LTFNLIGAITFLPVLIIPILLPGQTLYQLRGIWLILSILGQGLAVLILFMGLFQTDPWQFFGLRQLIRPSGEGEQKLVVSGFYRCVRHPLYVAGLIFIWLIPMMTTSLLVLNLGLTLYIYIGSIFEERRLLIEHGSAYVAYRSEVPRLIPRLGHCLSKHS
jgi:protein-S-isoprenylcysteine O-methyltransferase Ste14